MESPTKFIKPKIALFTQWYLPGSKAGGPVRSIFSLIELMSEYFEFYVITTNCDLGENTAYKNIEPKKWIKKNGNQYYYFDIQSVSAKNNLQLLKEINPDVIYLNSFWSFQFSISLLLLKWRGKIKTPIVLAPRGMLSNGAMGIKHLKKNLFIFISKLFGLHKKIIFHATQQQEESEILSFFPESKIKIAPNVNAMFAEKNRSLKNENKISLFYLSRISSVKNLDYALKLLSKIPLNFEINYNLFGNIEHSDYWKKCEELIAILPKNVKVIYKGELEFYKIKETLLQQNVLLLPTLNENFGHSIVESLLCGCPVIISNQTPWNDLEQHGAGFAINLKEEKKFIDAIEYYAKMNQAEFEKASMAANNYISKKINTVQIVEQYKLLFNDSSKN